MEDLRGPLHRFAMSTFDALRIQQPTGNMLFSPMTASAGLVLIYIGADGTTKYEIEKALHLTDIANGTSKTDNDIQMAFRMTIAALSRSAAQQEEPGFNDHGELKVFRMNRLFVQEGIYLNADFIDRVKKLRGEITEIDFKNTPAMAVRKMLNSYVNEGMNGKVPGCFDNLEDPIGKDAKLVLANGICFRARWDVTFDPSKTAPRPFYGVDGKSSVDVPMMKATMFLPYVEDVQNNILYLEIPYVFNKASLLIFLPKERKGLKDLQAAMNPRVFNRLALTKRLKEVELVLPKFTLQTITDFKAMLTSKKVGVKSLFTDEADLSKMVSDGGVSLSAGVHAGYYSIDENGTDADGTTDPDPDGKKSLDNRRNVTSLTTTKSQEIASAKKPIQFIVDHPFLFAVRHNKSGIMVCLGRVESIGDETEGRAK